MTRYQVTGTFPFRGHKPGETFDDELSPEQEARAKAAGAIRVVKRTTDDDAQKDKGGEDA